jgi:membrane protein YqaA with SNARE-associated domain
LYRVFGLRRERFTTRHTFKAIRLVTPCYSASMWNFLQQAPRRAGRHGFSSMLRHLGAAGLFFLAILDSSPLPTFGGLDIATAILASTHGPLWYEYAATATAGSVLGAYFTFRLARAAGSAYLDKKFKQNALAKFRKLFERWGSSTLFASTAIPLPTPTSMFFAAAGASDFPRKRFLGIVLVARSLRYFGIAWIAGHYGRHFLRILRHPLQYWGWMLLFLSITAAMIVAGIVASRRLEEAPAK